MSGAPLLEEPFAADAVGEPHHREGPPGEMREHHRPDPGVVVDDLTFGEARGRVDHLLEVGQAETATVELHVGRGSAPSRTLFPSRHDLRR